MIHCNVKKSKYTFCIHKISYIINMSLIKKNKSLYERMEVYYLLMPNSMLHFKFLIMLSVSQEKTLRLMIIFT